MSKRDGNLTWRNGRAYVRLFITPKNRPSIMLPTCRTPEQADKRVQLMGAMTNPIRDIGRPALAVEMAKRIARARNDVELEAVRIAIDALVDGSAVPRTEVTGTITFKEFAELWTSGELHRRWPNRVADKKTAKQDEMLMAKHVFPTIGGMPITAITLDHCEDVLARMPKGYSSTTVRHVAQLIARVLKLAVFPARLIPISPVKPGFLPKVERSAAYAYLYPDEDAALMGCADVPLLWRLLYGVLDREGMRVGEARGLEWSDLDLVRGVVSLDENKTDEPRAWSLNAGVAEAFRRWAKLHPSPKPGARVFVYPDGAAIDAAARAEEFRAHLKVAGVSRPQLFERTASRRPIRIHDLRATFVTTSLACGKSETWVADRTGHKSSSQINGYRRKSRTHAELGLGDLGDLAGLIPELARVGMARAG